MPAPQHVLVVVRHSKAEQGGRSDYERELTDRGRRDAAAAGAWLAGEGVAPDRALVSAASRAAQTWNGVASGAGWSVEAELDRGLYTAGPDTALDVLRGLGEDVGCAVIVGHNPTMAVLAQILNDGEGDADAGSAMAAGFPTSAVAVFAYDGAWADLESARLTGFHVGRG